MEPIEKKKEFQHQDFAKNTISQKSTYGNAVKRYFGIKSVTSNPPAPEIGIAWNTKPLNPVSSQNTVDLMYFIEPIAPNNDQQKSHNSFYGCQFPHGYIGVVDWGPQSQSQNETIYANMAFIFGLINLENYPNKVGCLWVNDDQGASPAKQTINGDVNGGSMTTRVPILYPNDNLYQMFNFKVTYTWQQSAGSTITGYWGIGDDFTNNDTRWRWMAVYVVPNEFAFQGMTHDFEEQTGEPIYEKGYYSFVQDLGDPNSDGMRTATFDGMRVYKNGIDVNGITSAGNTAFTNHGNVFINNGGSVSVQSVRLT